MNQQLTGHWFKYWNPGCSKPKSFKFTFTCSHTSLKDTEIFIYIYLSYIGERLMKRRYTGFWQWYMRSLLQSMRINCYFRHFVAGWRQHWRPYRRKAVGALWQLPTNSWQTSTKQSQGMSSSVLIYCLFIGEDLFLFCHLIRRIVGLTLLYFHYKLWK